MYEHHLLIFYRGFTDLTDKQMVWLIHVCDGQKTVIQRRNYSDFIDIRDSHLDLRFPAVKPFFVKYQIAATTEVLLMHW